MEEDLGDDMDGGHGFPELGLYIDGEFRPGASGHTQSVTNPATAEVLGWSAVATPADLDDALSAVHRAFQGWSVRPAFERQDIIETAADLMRQRRDRIARILTQEMGKPLAEARSEVDASIAMTRWYAEEGKRAYGRLIPPRASGLRHSVLKEPVGPVLAFTSWNFPAINVVRKIAGALAAGCTIIIKPSEETPATAIELARCFHDAGLPAGALNMVFGVPSEISSHLMRSPIPRKVSVTGSVAIGKLITRLASETLKRCTLELGGHASAIIARDADLAGAADLLCLAKFRNAGQICTSPTRFLIEEGVYRDFCDAFAERSVGVVVGNGLDEATHMGSLLAERRIAWAEGLVEDAVSRGATLRTGGARIGAGGSFFAPTVLEGVSPALRAMNDEPFAPIALMMPVASIDAALAEANRLRVGLAGYGFTRSQATALKIQSKLDAGVIAINQTVVSIPEAPFGGVNETGWGSEGGFEGLDAFLRIKFVNERPL